MRVVLDTDQPPDPLREPYGASPGAPFEADEIGFEPALQERDRLRRDARVP
jgi:hypothetical protein